MAKERELMGIYELQHYLGFYTADTLGDMLRVTETTKAEMKTDNNEYSPKYLDRKNQPKYITGRTTTIEFELGAVLPGDVQAAIAKHEDDINVPCMYMRTLDRDIATGVKCAADKLIAKRATATMTPSPISGEAGDPAKLSCTVSLNGDWEYGTYDPKTKKFTATVAPGIGG